MAFTRLEVTAFSTNKSGDMVFILKSSRVISSTMVLDHKSSDWSVALDSEISTYCIHVSISSELLVHTNASDSKRENENYAI